MHMQLICLFLIGTFTLKCSAIECYRCINCRDTFKQKSPVPGCEFCQTTTSYENKDIIGISRDCVKKCTPANTVIQGSGDRIECCATDLCNGACVKMGASIVMLILCFASFLLPW